LVSQLGETFETFPLDWVSYPRKDGYRHRLRLRISESGRIGFFNQEKSIECPVVERTLLERMQALLTFAEGREQVLAELGHLELRAADLDGKTGACFYPRDASRSPSRELVEQLQTLEPSWLWAIAHPDAVIPCQRHALNALYHFVPLTSFLQVNRVVNEALVTSLVEGARARSLGSFCDLYAGAGNFTLPLLAQGCRGVAVEYDRRAVTACERSANAQGFTSGRYLTGDAATLATELDDQGARFDLVIVDPPRAGARDAIATMAHLTTSHLVYCSCNPTSLAKDLRVLVSLGMTLEQITAFDMFEGTRHLETCVWLRTKAR
jgi:tRNA/tmRNA/rRNA uracil-C5-methylase (TrmA/RlmC/RlmD family)